MAFLDTDQRTDLNHDPLVFSKEPVLENPKTEQEILRDCFRRFRIAAQILDYSPESYRGEKALESGIPEEIANFIMGDRAKPLGKDNPLNRLINPIEFYGELRGHRRFLGLRRGKVGVAYELFLNDGQRIEANCYLQTKKRQGWETSGVLVAPTIHEVKELVLYAEWAIGIAEKPATEPAQSLEEKPLATVGS